MNESWKRARKAVPFLTVLTPLAALISIVSVAVSMCSSEWLTSDERIPLESINLTNRDDFRIKKTVSGLWSLCSCVSCNLSSETEMNCFTIDYFSKDRYAPEPHDSTMAICYAVTKAGPLFILSSISLSIALLLAIIGYCSRKMRIGTFISGIISIISGLSLLIGLVVYLSVLQSEIGTKLRPRNSLDSPPFVYHYGLGFILVVVGFMFTELTGTCQIFLYIYWHQLDWAEKAGCKNGNGTGSDKNNGGTSIISGDVGLRLNQNNINNSKYHHHNQNQDDGGFTHFNQNPLYLQKVRCKKHGTFLAPSSSTITQLMPSNPRCRCNCNCNNEESSHHQFSTLPGRGYNHTGNTSNKRGCSGTGSNHVCRESYYSYDDLSDFDVPLPPPPPVIPRDLTCTTTVSDYFYSDVHPPPRERSRERDNRDRHRDKGSSSRERKTTPV